VLGGEVQVEGEVVKGEVMYGSRAVCQLVNAHEDGAAGVSGKCGIGRAAVTRISGTSDSAV
jgi:hypothetical protein